MRRGWVIGLLVLAECSPSVGFEIKFSLPDGQTIDASKLHLRGRARCARGSVTEHEKLPVPVPPPPGLEEQQHEGMFDPRRSPSDPAYAYARFRGSTCEVALTAWYDTNDDQFVNAGDFVASYPTSTIRSHLACSDTANHFGTLPLAPFKP